MRNIAAILIFVIVCTNSFKRPFKIISGSRKTIVTLALLFASWYLITDF